jgi:hypothetical protein
MTRLATAAMVVILYLSGVRPGEALELQVGCCPDPIDDGTGSIRYQLHGLFFKGARNPDGTPARDGVPREVPWTVVPPVADAVRVLERIVDGPLLFPTNPPWIASTPGRRQRTGDAMTTLGANARIASFIAWVNDYADSNGMGDELIPNDPTARSSSNVCAGPSPGTSAAFPAAASPWHCNTDTYEHPSSARATPAEPARACGGCSTSKPHEPWPTTSTPSPTTCRTGRASPARQPNA